MKNWEIAPVAPVEWTNEFPEIPGIVLQALYNRGLRTQEEIDHYLHPDYSRDILDPYLFNDMKKVVDRLYQAIDNKELIFVHGDYDADGVSGAVILRNVLTELGANVEVFLPHREKDGYGLNMKTVEYIKDKGGKIIITCDCGISNAKEVAQAKEYGIDSVVTDHHQIPENVPEAFGIIHPKLSTEKYPFKELAGGGVAFKLAQAMLTDSRSNLTPQQQEAKEKWLLDLVALSSVADMVSLTGENRTLVNYGLQILKLNKRLGLQKLFELTNVDPNNISGKTIGFQIAPRINAAGRMDHANTAYALLVEEQETEAMRLAKVLEENNLERQKKTEVMVKQAKAQYQETDDPILFFYQADWPLGLTGLVAGQLVRKYNKPCIVMGSDGEKVVGSGRSVPGINILESIKTFKDKLVAFGGHPQACGFRVLEEDLASFKENVLQYVKESAKDVSLEPVLKIDSETRLGSINWDVADMLELFAPFGIDNEEPIFASRGVEVETVVPVGKDLNHVKLVLRQEDKKVPAIAFNLAKLELKPQQIIDIAFSVNINQWNGNKEIQLQIKDIKT